MVNKWILGFEQKQSTSALSIFIDFDSPLVTSVNLNVYVLLFVTMLNVM